MIDQIDGRMTEKLTEKNKRPNQNNYKFSSASVVDKILFHLCDVYETLLESINKNNV